METLLYLGLANAASATLLALIVAAGGRLLSRRPAVLHCFWLLVLLKLVTPPLWDVPMPSWEPCTTESAIEAGGERDRYVLETADDPAEALITTSIEPEIPSSEVHPGPEPWRGLLLPALAGFWICGAIASLVVAGVRVARFRRLLEQAYPASAEVQDEVDLLALRLGMRRVPDACWIDARITPMLWAVGCRPRVILPRDLWDKLEGRQRSMILVHELAHVRRGDHAVRLFELAVTTLFWWLPTVWWARRALHDVEEQCCDAWVTWAFPKDARSYAETLLETIDFVHASGSPEPVLATGFGKVHHLRKRLTMIMLGTTTRRLTWRGALGALAAGALLLPMSPSWAQKPKEPVEQQVFVVTSDEVVSPTVVTVTDPIKTEIELVVADENQKTAIKADSLDHVKKLLAERIEILAKDQGSEAADTQIKALKQVLADLEKAKARNFTVKVDGPDARKVKESKEQTKIYLRKLGDEAKASPEAKAKIDKAKARLEKIRAELRTKQKELAEAERDLFKLSSDTGDFLIHGPGVVELHGKPLTIESRIVARSHGSSASSSSSASGSGSGSAGGRGIGVGVASLSDKDHKRLETMEKQIAELLEQVKSLKKQGLGEKP